MLKTTIKENADFFWHIINVKEKEGISARQILRWINSNKHRFGITEEQFDKIMDYYIFEYNPKGAK
jgi:hypothetical protein